MATVFLGNRAPREVPPGLQVHVNDERVEGDAGKPAEGKTIVVIVTPTHDSEGNKIGVGKRLTEIRNAFNVHSHTGKPEWVESHDEDFAKMVADEFNCQVGRPDDWDEKPAEPEGREAAQPEEDKPFSEKVPTFLSDQRDRGELDES